VALLPLLVALAEEDEAVRNLKAGLTKTVRRLKALENVVMPELEREVREVAAAIAEEERDEAFRRDRLLARRSATLPLTWV
jgi:V/A-type H+-transporting ATPase subunit D